MKAQRRQPEQIKAPRALNLMKEYNTQLVAKLEEKNAELQAQTAALCQSVSHKQAILDSALDCIVAMDHEGRIVEFNPAAERTFGFTRAEALGHAMDGLIIPAALRERYRRGLAHYLATGEGPALGKRLELTALRKDGAEFPIELTIARIADTAPPMFTGFVRDITERTRAEGQIRKVQEQLKQTNRDLVRRNEEIQYFYHTLSHELKTPLTSAREFVSIVMDGLAGEVNETQLSYLRIAKESCTQMAVYMNDLLDATRLDTGKLHMELKPVSLLAIIQRAMTIMKPAAAGKNIRLSEEFDTHLPEVMVDESRIAQILTNLLNNALKFTPEGGGIAVKLGQDPKRPERVLISVTDTGCGVPKDQLENIFRRFYQIKQGDCTPEKGVGLGLYLCRELVLLHGGTIDVESELGKGSTFSVVIPKHGIKKGARVLIVDDDEGVRESLRLILEKHGFDVIKVGGGSEALQVMSLKAPDVVVLDLVMDGLDGTGTLEEIRKNWGLVPVIVYTGHPDGDLMRRAMEFSPFTLLAKPCPPKRFVETVRRVCHTNDTRFLKKQASSSPALPQAA
jgi:PAS domain S-box-containing protein